MRIVLVVYSNYVYKNVFIMNVSLIVKFDFFVECVNFLVIGMFFCGVLWLRGF